MSLIYTWLSWNLIIKAGNTFSIAFFLSALDWERNTALAQEGKAAYVGELVLVCVCVGRSLVLQLQRKAKVWGTLWPEIDILCPSRQPPSPPLSIAHISAAPAALATHRKQFEKKTQNKRRKNTEKNWLQALSLSFTDDNGRRRQRRAGHGCWPEGGWTTITATTTTKKEAHTIIDKHRQQIEEENNNRQSE